LVLADADSIHFGLGYMMLTMRKELLISLSDIEAFCIECGTCHSQIRVASSATIKMDWHKLAPLEYCPACQAEFGEALKPKLQALRASIANLAGTIPTVTLQISADALSSQQ
jgi:hypothetical protein